MIHQVAVSDDGNTAYVAIQSCSPDIGVFIFDVSEVQARKRSAKIKMLGSVFVPGFTGGQFTHPLVIQGRKYVYYTTVRGKGLGGEAACNGLPTYGYAHVIDVEDPTKRVSRLELEVSDPANCVAVRHDPVTIGYGATKCDVDNYQDAS